MVRPPIKLCPKRPPTPVVSRAARDRQSDWPAVCPDHLSLRNGPRRIEIARRKLVIEPGRTECRAGVRWREGQRPQLHQLSRLLRRRRTSPYRCLDVGRLFPLRIVSTGGDRIEAICAHSSLLHAETNGVIVCEAGCELVKRRAARGVCGHPADTIPYRPRRYPVSP
jgi:hypothetical protein